MTTLWLIRHGQTDWNKEGRYQGQLDIPLNAEGLLQAEEAAHRLIASGEQFSAIYSSDLLRARQTAETVARRLSLEVRFDGRLREIYLGQWQGRLHAEVRKERSAAAAAMTDSTQVTDPNVPHAPGGESVAQVAERACQAVESFTRRHPRGSIIVVAHGVVIASLLCAAHGVPLCDFRTQSVRNAEVTAVLWPPTPPPAADR